MKKKMSWVYVPEYGVDVRRDGAVRLRGKIKRTHVQNGYLAICLADRRVHIHRIVATAFCEKKCGCDCVDHIDGNKQNNAPENLEWVTLAENSRRAARMTAARKLFRRDEAAEGIALETMLTGLSEIFSVLPDFAGISDEELAA